MPTCLIDFNYETFNNLNMKIIIIGGVAAGAKAAAKSKRILPDANNVKLDKKFFRIAFV